MRSYTEKDLQNAIKDHEDAVVIFDKYKKDKSVKYQKILTIRAKIKHDTSLKKKENMKEKRRKWFDEKYSDNLLIDSINNIIIREARMKKSSCMLYDSYANALDANNIHDVANFIVHFATRKQLSMIIDNNSDMGYNDILYLLMRVNRKFS